MRLSLLSQLLIVIGLVLILALGSIGWYTSVQVNQTLRQLTENSVSRTGPLVRGSVESFLQASQRQCRSNAAELGKGSILSDQISTSADFPDFANSLVEEFTETRNVTFMSFSLGGTGDYMHLQRVNLSDGREVIKWQTSIRQPDGTFQLKEYDYTQGVFRLTDQKDHWDYDPRQRDFYKIAAQEKSTIWTPIYLLRNKFQPNAKQWGVTCATPVVNHQGTVLGVATVDLSLESLTRFLDTLRIGDGSFSFLMERTPSGSLGLLGLPDGAGKLVQVGPSQDPDSVQLKDLPRPTLDEISPVLAEFHRREKGGTRSFIGTGYDTDHGSYYGGFVSLGSGYPAWTVFSIASDRDFTGDLGPVQRVLGTFVVAALILAMGLAFILAQRVAQPLRAIADETNSIRFLDLEDRPNPKTSVWEVEVLNNSVDSMKGTLRSMLKLVPSEYARYLITRGQDIHPGGERRRLTIMFADLVGFTSFSERQAPEDVFTVLDDYLTIMGDAVTASEGTIDKFTGDGLMAFWGAPLEIENPAIQACNSVLSTESKLPEAQALSGQAMRITYGIATGEVLVGNIGTPTRLNYTVLGDAANLAARLQGLNKLLGTTALTDEATAKEAMSEFLVRPVVWTIVQGREEPLIAYEIMCRAGEATKAQKHLAKGCRLVMSRLKKGDRLGAEEILEELENAFPEDRPIRLMQEMLRSQESNLLPFDPRSK